LKQLQANAEQDDREKAKERERKGGIFFYYLVYYYYYRKRGLFLGVERKEKYYAMGKEI